MKAVLREVIRLTDLTLHNAFTSLCRWRDRYYCAYRVAQSHNILPRGHLVLRDLRVGREDWDSWHDTFELPHADLRDPKFLVTPDCLYLFCGAYLSHPAYAAMAYPPGAPLMLPNTPDNLLQTYMTFTTDGETWAPLMPILRAGYWGWSAIASQEACLMASYHSGATWEASSIVLWSGEGMRDLRWMRLIYDGASHEREDPMRATPLRYQASEPSEPVLWGTLEDRMLGCCLRTDRGLVLGYGRVPYQAPDWRWTHTNRSMHPSAVLQTAAGTFLAAREQIVTKRDRAGLATKWASQTTLSLLEGHVVRPLLTFPSGGDTGYAGLCAGEDGTILLSYYSSHEVPDGLPGSAVYVATVELQG